jgi:hypothetical protein
VSFTLSPQIKILALVGVLAIVGLLASMTLLGRSSSPSADSTPVQTTPRVTTTVTPPKPTTTTPVKTATKHHAATKPAHKAAAKPKIVGNKVYATLPAPLQWQLSQHKVVVVSTYDPHADVDAISVNEAHAGAADAQAGFLLVSVLDNSVAGPLTALLPGGGLLPDPGVLVYKAPGNIVFRFDGFVDRDTVAQAAANALAGQVGVATSSTATTTTAAPLG